MANHSRQAVNTTTGRHITELHHISGHMTCGEGSIADIILVRFGISDDENAMQSKDQYQTQRITQRLVSFDS